MKKNIYSIIGAIGLTLALSGCSENVFTIGYENSSCEGSAANGVCGSPKDIAQYSDIIKKTQSDYLHAQLDTTLYFGISPKGYMAVKEDRDGHFQPYKGSKWESLINKRLAENDAKGLGQTNTGTGTSGSNSHRVIDEDDLSIKFQRQGDLIRTRTSLGNILRDNGEIREVFIETYQDRGGDLISGHEAHVVVKDPSWVVGEDVPKGSRLNKVPTPISTELFNTAEANAQYSNNMQRRTTVRQPSKSSRTVAKTATSSNSDMKVINNYIK